MAAFSRHLKQMYDVFLSFRGEDTRNDFTGHLHAALCRKKVNAYIDDDSLEKGDEILSALWKAIEESKISVVIFSENYASSSWCLNELVHILHCKEVNKQLVIPVFYHVDPSDIREQRNSYGVAFAKHEQRFKDEKVQQWRNALKEAGNMCGWHIQVTRSKSKVVEEIVQDILKKLHNMSSRDDFKDLVGIEERVEKIEKLLHFSWLDVRIIGIWGMGGIGKTTLAEVTFSRFAPQFESCCFLRNIKESKPYKLVKLQKKLFSELLKEHVENVNQFVMNRLQGTKVLIVLDDVDDLEQLEYLARDRSWFGYGSRIIITTRDKQVLHNVKVDETFEVDELSPCEALQLFYTKAFKEKSSSPAYAEMSKIVVTKYCKGVPLALKVLGCHLFSKSIEEWESELKKLEIIPHNKVQNVLKISYDGLSLEEKNIFLDIAFFFTGKKQDFAKRILNGCHLGVAMGIRVLIDKSLLTIDHSNQLIVHDLVKDMGIEIVRQQSPYEPGKRSRLCSTKDVCNVLKNNAGTPEIQGISMDMSKIGAAICLSPRVFETMHNLKFLKIFGHCVEGKLYFPNGLKYLPDELRYLHWDGFPQKSLPKKFWHQNLIELHLNNSKLKKLWDGDQHIVSLEVLNLQDSENLTEIPDLSWALNMKCLNLGGCTHLKHPPSGIEKLELLQVLDLGGCLNIDKFPELPKNIASLHMSSTAIENVPPSIEHLSHLLAFDLSNCKRLKSLPTNCLRLKSLQELYLEGCLALEYFPKIKEPTDHVAVLESQESGIRQLPSSIGKLFGITKLVLQDSTVSDIPDWLFCLPVLDILTLSETNTIRIPESIKLSKLRFLFVKDCKFLQSLPALPFSIEFIDARGCISLEMMSNSWHLLAQGPKGAPFVRERFSFDGCIRLDHKNIIIEFQLRALFNALTLVEVRRKGGSKFWREVQVAPLYTTVEQFYPTPISERHRASLDVLLYFPGDEIPEWFSYENVGCSVDIKPPPLWYTNFMGFAFCFVVEDSLDADIGWNIYLNWEIYLKTNCNDERCLEFVSLSTYFEPYDLNRVLMVTYLDTDFVDFESAIEMSFHFSFDDPLQHKIKSCGIRMLYLQDAIEFGIISDQRGGFWKTMLYPFLGFQEFPSRQQLCEKILSCTILLRHKISWFLLVCDFWPIGAATTCPLCGMVLESVTHLFLYCESVRPLWYMSPWGLRTDSLGCDSMASFLELVLFGDPHSDINHFDEEFLFYASILVDTIWLARTELVHKGKVFDIADIHASVQARFNNIIPLEPYP